jgi:hypothetical protein
VKAFAFTSWEYILSQESKPLGLLSWELFFLQVKGFSPSPEGYILFQESRALALLSWSLILSRGL